MKQFNMDARFQMQIINTRIEKMVNQAKDMIPLSFFINLQYPSLLGGLIALRWHEPNEGLPMLNTFLRRSS